MGDFEMYEQDYLALKESFKNDINAYSRLTDEQRYNAIDRMKKSLADADQQVFKFVKTIHNLMKQIKHMEREALSTKSNPVLARVKKHRSDHNDNRKRLMQEEEKLLDVKSRDNLFGSNDSSGNRFENAEIRGRLLNTNEKVYGQNQKLEDANKVAYEAETLAAQAGTNLRGQRDMILIGVDEAKGLNKELHTVQKIEEKIASKNRCVKILLYLVILILLATDITILVFKIRKSNSTA